MAQIQTRKDRASPRGRDVLMLTTRAVVHDQRVVREAQALQAAGHRVRLLEWARHSPDAPRDETVSGIPVRRVHDTLQRRVLRAEILRTPGWWRRAVREAVAWHDEQAFDVVHAHDLDTLVPGTRLKRRLGIPLVFDAHEIFHQMLEGNQPGVVVRAARRLEGSLLPHVDLVVTSHDGSAAYYRRRVSVPVVSVWNTFGAAPDRYVAPQEPEFTATYIGILSRDRMFPSLIDAIGALPGIRLVVAGKREGVWEQVAARAAVHPNVDFLGPLPFDDVLPTTLRGHAVLCLLDPKNPQYRVAPATKLFDAMSCGRPIITTEGTFMGDFVAREEVGIACAYDPADVQAALAKLRDDPRMCRRMGENGLRLARAQYNWAAQTSRLMDAYSRLAEVGA